MEPFIYNSSIKSMNLQNLNREVNAGRPIIAVGAGSGLAAKAAVAGGADLLIVYNSGYYRSHGYGSLAGLMPFGNANQIAFEVGSHVMAAVGDAAPVLVGLCASDPLFKSSRTLERVRSAGFQGVTNFPTVGLVDVDSHFRASLEETGFGYDKEVDMIKEASKLGLFTLPYVFTEEEATAMVSGGADAIAIHLGLTISNLGGKSSRYTLETAAPFIDRMFKKAKSINPKCLVLVHGGPLNSMEDYRTIQGKLECPVDGFVGASTFERTPVYDAIKEAVQSFKEGGSVVN